MYYKVINKESEIYKQLFEQRTLELQYEEENKKAIEEKAGSKWTSIYATSPQSSPNRVTDYSGFIFTNPEKLDAKAWKIHKEHTDPPLFVPNAKTKVGREMRDFLNHELKGIMFTKIFEIIGFENYHGRFTMPFLDIEGDVILLYIDERFTPTKPEIIEITRIEFETIRGTIKTVEA